jgi:hypothetical protein
LLSQPGGSIAGCPPQEGEFLSPIPNSSGENITGEVIRGSYGTGTISAGADLRLNTSVKPDKHRLRIKKSGRTTWARKKYIGYLNAASQQDREKRIPFASWQSRGEVRHRKMAKAALHLNIQR